MGVQWMGQNPSSAIFMLNNHRVILVDELMLFNFSRPQFPNQQSGNNTTNNVFILYIIILII